MKPLKIYASVERSSVQLNPWKNQPKKSDQSRSSKSRFASRFLSKRAQRAGLRVSETNVEIETETAIVNANWR